jgi:hypothetical protein
MTFPKLRQTVLDSTDSRRLAEFWRQLLGYTYRAGDEPPPAGEPDVKTGEWLVLLDADGAVRLGFQHVEEMPRVTWPSGPIPQQLHLDTTVSSAEELEEQRRRALALGAEQILDRHDDPEEPLYVFADPAGHPFCIFVA